jgi:hypothetical protein
VPHLLLRSRRLGISLAAIALAHLVGAPVADAAYDGAQRRCRSAIVRAGTSFARTSLRIATQCHRDRLAGRIASGTDCGAIESVDERRLLERERLRSESLVLASCSAPSVSPARIGYLSCPAPCDTEVPEIGGVEDVLACALCGARREAESLISLAAGTPAAALPVEGRRCLETALRTASTEFGRHLKLHGSCQRKHEKSGEIDEATCAELSAEVDSRDLQRAIGKIERRCASADPGQVFASSDCAGEEASEVAGCILEAAGRSATIIMDRILGSYSQGRAGTLWEHSVLPLLDRDCAPCHQGPRFGFAAVQGTSPFDTEATAANREAFLDQVSLDAPHASRLLRKGLGGDPADGLAHGGGARFSTSSPEYAALLEWIQEEKRERCAECGLDAPRQFVAYVEQPRIFWALARDPIRTDHGLRDRARIWLQPLEPGRLRPMGEPIDFLGESFCGADGRCDFGHLAASHDGTMLAFECRMGEEGQDWVHDVRWNVCIADIGADGRAVNPRRLRPSVTHGGRTIARSDPFGLYGNDGWPLKGVYDHHFQVRRRDDRTPTFGPADQWVYISSRSPDPRTGSDGTRTYHGFEHVNNIIAIRTDGSEERTVYRNEGGQADFPFFRRNGNLAFHTWNLERMDRHLYTQSSPDGDMERPVLLGRVQGENRWGKAVETASGIVLGMTGRRRAAADNYVLFRGDHTLGAGLAGNPDAITVLDAQVHEQIAPFPNGYCRTPPDGENCVVDRWYGDPAWAPDGRALVSYNSRKTYVLQGEEMYLGYAEGSNLEERLAAMLPYTPTKLGISLIDDGGRVQRLIDPAPGMMLRYPTWVGRRSPPRQQPELTDESVQDGTIHIAHFPIWLSFRRGPDHTGGSSKANQMKELDRIVAVRVLVKEMDGNACLNDGRPYRFAVNSGYFDHPTHLGISNATGYRKLVVPLEDGGNPWGDVPLEADGSVHLRLPAGELLLFQGIDAEGHVVRQHSRLMTLAPGRHVDTAVRGEQYEGQCSACHGSIRSDEPWIPLTSFEQIPPAALDFETIAATNPPVDLSHAGIERKSMTYLDLLRPLLDQRCVGCHTGSSPAGELSLASTYSAHANYPAGRWAAPHWGHSSYMDFVPPEERVPGYDYSVAWSWLQRQDQNEYRSHPEYADRMAGFAPVAELAPWDPGYQNLWANDGSVLVYLSGYRSPNFGRGDRQGGNSRDSWLIEILTGLDLSPARDFEGPDHTGYLDEAEVRDLMGLIDLGFPFMARCDDKVIPSGPHAGQPWGDPFASE